MNQLLSPDAYAALSLPDQWIEDEMQQVEARWIVQNTNDDGMVLELGWGSGIVAKALQAAGRRVFVVDGAKRFVDDAAAAGIPSMQGMFEEVSFQNCESVIASFILEHVADPVALLKRIREWTSRLIIVIGNAESWHRRLGVQMGVQPKLDTLSPRDHAVGHYRVYDMDGIRKDLSEAGWRILEWKGLMFKPLPNAMMQHFDQRLIQAMAEIEVAPQDAANIGIVCERV